MSQLSTFFKITSIERVTLHKFIFIVRVSQPVADSQKGLFWVSFKVCGLLWNFLETALSSSTWLWLLPCHLTGISGRGWPVSLGHSDNNSGQGYMEESEEGEERRNIVITISETKKREVLFCCWPLLSSVSICYCVTWPGQIYRPIQRFCCSFHADKVL